jgi:hypothetical protein
MITASSTARKLIVLDVLLKGNKFIGWILQITFSGFEKGKPKLPSSDPAFDVLSAHW